ncbi:MAG: tetratricopeptide repeat protein, partial [Cytophagaceae bacterium]|nr:tetratricopeptide repeat protein [Cytophagaceae bacterium]
LELTKSKNAVVLASIAEFYIDYDKLEVPQANNLLNTALKYDAKNPNHYILIGDGFWKIQDGSKAVENYDKALALNPKNPKALTRLGDSYIKVMNYNRALDYYSKALAADSLYAPAYKGMGDAYYKNKQFDKAQTAYKKYVAMADQNDDTYIKYSSFLIMSKDYANALTYLQKMEDKENINPVAYRLLGMAYFEKGDMEKSQKNFDKLFAKLDNKKLMAVDYEYYGKLMAKSKKDSLAMINLEKSLQMDSSRVDLYSDLGNAYFGMNKYDKAQKAFEKKVKAGAGSQDLYFLGLSYYYDNKFDKADTTFGTLLKYVPTYTQGYLWKAKIKANLDPTSEKGLAKPYYEKFIDMTKNDVEKNKKEIIKAYEYLGYYYYLNKDKVKGKEVYTKLKEIDPNSKSAVEGLKWVNGK